MPDKEWLVNIIKTLKPDNNILKITIPEDFKRDIPY